jgi:hypothetical protein
VNRVDSDDPGDWVQSQNDGAEDPFITEFTVSDVGAHEVDFRSVDNAGNEEETTSVAFEIGEQGEPALSLNVKPKRASAKVGKTAKFTATARNTGDGAASQVKVCAKAPKKKVKIVGRRCATADELAADERMAPKFKLRPTRKARGRKVTIKFTATAAGLPVERAQATLKVRR